MLEDSHVYSTCVLTGPFPYTHTHTDLASDCLPDWLVEPVSLPSPEEQPGADVVFSPQCSPFSSSHCSSQGEPFPVLTPDSSHPPSPHSSYYSDDPEINDVMCSLLEEEESYQFSPHATLPIPPTSPSSFQLPLASDNSFGSLNTNLSEPDPKAETPQCLPGNQRSSRKRKSPSSQPSGKRKASAPSKKERKREQNKTAALRYRQRKKEEKQDVEGRREMLEEHNGVLRSEVEALTNEIQYLKKLWREVCEAKQRQQQC